MNKILLKSVTGMYQVIILIWNICSESNDFYLSHLANTKLLENRPMRYSTFLLHYFTSSNYTTSVKLKCITESKYYMNKLHPKKISQAILLV